MGIHPDLTSLAVQLAILLVIAGAAVVSFRRRGARRRRRRLSAAERTRDPRSASRTAISAT